MLQVKKKYSAQLGPPVKKKKDKDVKSDVVKKLIEEKEREKREAEEARERIKRKIREAEERKKREKGGSWSHVFMHFLNAEFININYQSLIIKNPFVEHQKFYEGN